jgi:hypothetical protein
VKTRHTTNTAIKLQIITNFWRNDLHDTRTCRGIKGSNINKTENDRYHAGQWRWRWFWNYLFINTTTCTTKNYKNATIIWGILWCCGTNALGGSSRNMQLYHNKHGLLAEPHICWAHIADCSLNIYRREKDSEQYAGKNETHSPQW